MLALEAETAPGVLIPGEQMTAAIRAMEAMRGEERMAYEEALGLASQARDAMPAESEMDKEIDR